MKNYLNKWWTMLTDENIMKTEPVNPENDAMDLQLDENESLQGADGSSKLSETEALKEALNEQKDKYLRLFAEFDNYKKRTFKEKMDTIRNASQELIQEILPVLDDFERAQKWAEQQKDESLFPEGMRLLQHKLQTILKSKGLEPIESIGQTFDPNYHEAITEIAAGDDMKGKVVDSIERAYTLNDKIIRFAKVVVGK
ncbi:MAG: nucleotide exchange factor GrpE [Saprospiraceae bacterium]|jgi:molecular chaperone GrpE|nr:nucleotide exchange factor GrpE [Saprospiraceae bacterium]HQX45568.1 nucleotide exchange factor GrpE [Saprospiraceae bacterium]